MTTVVQFIVLNRENKWVVKSKDVERVFSVQQEAVDAAGCGALPKIESQFPEDLDIRREPLSAGEIGFAYDAENAEGEKISGAPRLGERPVAFDRSAPILEIKNEG
jgi:hypothetical protein